MNVNPISFGRKIPLYQSQVKNIQSDEYEPVTISEYDCKDTDDIEDMGNLGFKWKYACCLFYDMQNKYRYLKNPHIYNKRDFPIKFYVMNNKNGNIIGICETENDDENNGINIMFLESRKDKKYKYVGQTMLAAAGKIIQKNNRENLYVNNPAVVALSFYTQKCGFNPVCNDRFSPLKMNSSQITDFIKRTEEKTGSEMIDLQA